MLAGYDLWTTREVHWVTIWTSAFIIVLHRLRIPLGETAAWHSFASWTQNLAPGCAWMR